jgi:hypothetical protein
VKLDQRLTGIFPTTEDTDTPADNEAHGWAVAAHDQPIPVVLELVHPVGSKGGLAARVGTQGSTNPSVRMRAAMAAN